jgi:hypothetical protein
MIQQAYIIRCNDNPIAVVLNKQTLAETEKVALVSRDFSRNRSQYDNDMTVYLARRRWDIIVIKVTEKVTTPYDPEPEARSHVSETFPQPQQQKLPGQTQLKRVQLPAAKVVAFNCPVCESTTGKHLETCPEARVDLKGEGKG